MAEHFTIDLDRMRSVSRQLGECGERMGSAAKRLKDLGKGKQLGTERLDSACKGFEHHWHVGIGRTSKLAHGLREGVDAALDTYEKNEQGVTQGFT
ncbi:hypothetical protein [Streptomyces sp. Y1]|uniref:ESX-1 secretion-associated protein n=1 Tax=Streptomyces sp. Y1 TaxID=3238634 RepID=A0AB39THV5_9ACTN